MLLLLGLLAFVVVAALVGAGAGGGLDGRLITWIEAHRRHPATVIAIRLSRLGVWWFVLALTALAAGLLAWAKRRQQAAYLLYTIALSLTLNLALKLLFKRHPPGDPAHLVEASNYAFPSGHTMTATAVATGLTMVAWHTRWRWPVLVIAGLGALTMGLSRVYLAVHWPSDVAAGWALGLTVALFVRAAFPWPFTTNGDKAEPLGSEEVAGEGAIEGPSEASADAAAGTPAPPPLEVVFLDWGDTIMVDYGTPGSMAEWPKVEAVAGAQEALGLLRRDHRLVVATNAGSNAAEVRKALARVGLDALVDEVVSSSDVGAAKPSPAFFEAALRAASTSGAPLAASRAVMVGDSWPNDMAGAKAAGLRTVWLNPSGAPPPDGAAPPDAEIAALAELPAAVARLARSS